MKERVFNRMKRHVFRKRIPLGEIVGGGVVVAVLAGAVVWVAAQEDRFDPGERDIRFAVLESQSVEDRLYRRPLKAWVEPGEALPGGGAGPRLGIFPPQILEGGWRVSTRLQHFDAANLYMKINGAAEQYLRYGFRALHYIGLASPDGRNEVSIELYDQGGFPGALAVFSSQRDPAKPVQRTGDGYYYRTAVGAIGMVGRYFFKIAGDAETPSIREKSLEIVAALATLPQRLEALPYGFRFFSERLGMSFAEISYQPVNVFQYDFAKDFWFGRPDPASPARLFLHVAESPAVAAELFDSILVEHAYDYEIVEEDEDAVVLRHEFLKSYFAMTLRDALIYGVEKAPRQETIQALSARLEEALQP